MLELERQLGRILVKGGYGRYLTLGAVLGVGSILIVFSLFENYYRAVEQLLLGIHPHVSLHKETFAEGDRRAVQRALAALGESVAASSPAIDLEINGVVSAVESFPVVCVGQPPGSSCFDFTTGKRPDPAGLRDEVGFKIAKTRIANLRLQGVEVQNGETLTDVRKVMDVRAAWDDLERLNKGPADGMPMACLFERTFIHGAGPLDDFLVRLPSIDGKDHFFRLVSTVNLGLKQGEHPLFITSLANVQTMLGRPGFYNTVEVRLSDSHAAPAVAANLRSRLEAEGISVRTWMDRDAGSFRLLDVLRRVIFVVIFSVMVVAALGIVSTLSLVVMENRGKIAILRAMGLRDLNIYLALVLECWQIAGLGLLVGIGVGWSGSAGLLRLPGFRSGLAKMGITDPRVLIEPMDVLALAAATLLLFFVVAMIPARDACRIDAVEGLQS